MTPHRDPLPIIDLDRLSERMKALRARLSLHQREVAAELGIPPRTFQSWENGEAQTGGDNYDLIAEYYSEKLDEPINRNQLLFGEDGPPPLPGVPPEDPLPARALAILRREMEARFAALETELREDLGMPQRNDREAPPSHQPLRARKAGARTTP